MSCIQNGLCVPADRRRCARRPVFESGSAVAIDGSRSVLIEDLSATGARVHGRGLPAVGKQVLIWMEGFDVLGWVAWKRPDQCGVLFEEALAAARLEAAEAHGANPALA